MSLKEMPGRRILGKLYVVCTPVAELAKAPKTLREVYNTVPSSETPGTPAPHFSSKMRLWKSETIRGRPCLSETFGSQWRRDLAFEMSGFLMCGSSAVFGLNSTLALGSIVSFTTCRK
jgi:hypothetical protein